MWESKPGLDIHRASPLPTELKSQPHNFYYSPLNIRKEDRHFTFFFNAWYKWKERTYYDLSKFICY